MPFLGFVSWATSTTTAKNGTIIPIDSPMIFTSNVDCWITQGATGGSATLGTAGEMFVKAGEKIPVLSKYAADGYVHVILASGTGIASLTRWP
jgi:hypothetical protein